MGDTALTLVPEEMEGAEVVASLDMAMGWLRSPGCVLAAATSSMVLFLQGRDAALG